MGLLSLAIWMPIAFGVLLLVLGRDEQARVVRWVALIGALASFLVTLPLYTGFKLGTAAMQFVGVAALDGALQRALPPGRGRHFALVRAADGLHQRDRGDRRLGSHHPPRQPVHGRLPDPERPDDRRLRRARRHAVLRLLRSHADPDVPDHRHLGRPEQDLRGLQVLPLHAAGLAAAADRADLPVHQVGWQLRHRHLARHAAGRHARRR